MGEGRRKEGGGAVRAVSCIPEINCRIMFRKELDRQRNDLATTFDAAQVIL